MIKDQNKVGPWANRPQKLVRNHKVLRPSAQMVLENVGLIQFLLDEIYFEKTNLALYFLYQGLQYGP